MWVPKLFGEEKDVPVATRFVPDARATHYWDSGSVLVRSYDTVLGLGQDAWDVYIAYGPAARWNNATPPAPDYWMHQLGHVNAPILDPVVFAAHADSLLRRTRSATPKS